ncbi:MAG: response regulator transcription factor [Pseudobutyrivibrio sp.]|nr:response regulator transcription factor [Pseudobutyrivibrio sp.]
MKILFLEDDDAIAMGLKYSLENESYQVSHAKTAAEAEAIFKKDDFDLCILDVNLPDGNGYDVCKKIKSQADTPVIFLTAYDDEVNVVMGLELGADDYICKPFRVKELMARIKTVIRRNEKSPTKEDASNIISIKNIRIYVKEAKVTRLDTDDNQEIDTELTAVEYRLLLDFVNNRGNVLTRNQILQDLWDVSGDFVNDNTLTVYIKRLRDKIELDSTNPEIIKTVRGIGYILEK